MPLQKPSALIAPGGFFVWISFGFFMLLNNEARDEMHQPQKSGEKPLIFWA
ncbi:hypothetical protein [Paraburkholderia tagetis]|uniref:Uncharacterized protein n=1 Tax=Paraburkholderia tagetis TaxID=2913261 RepID=A0A9X1UKJ4_9BURK|nr:hypothetical protein [Paraburkholderia tagetis]MCG5074441.1 hypothetical protein [Paraburkholderia tagetis]